MWDEYERNFFVDQYGGETWVRPLRDSIKTIVSNERYGVDVQFGRKDKASDGCKLICECGVYHSQDTIRPVSKDTAIEMTHRLVERLDEVGVEVDKDKLYDEVRERFSDPDMQGKQDRAFKEAVQLAVMSHG